MLHEILISLSGLSSSVWTQVSDSEETGSQRIRDYVSPPEQAMLADLSRLSELHIKLREHTTSISAEHPSIVCRAIGTSITNKHLAAFSKNITHVESLILRQDPSYVGGYNIVPLSTILAQFTPWTRRLECLLRITSFMMGFDPTNPSTSCSCTAVYRILEQERHTGYSDIEDIATDLLMTAQSVWMRYVSSWVLCGQLPDLGAADFMIQKPTVPTLINRHELKPDLVPIFVTKNCADAILATGSALNQLRSTSRTASNPAMRANIATKLLHVNLPQVKALSYPLNPSLLEKAMVSINQTVSRNALSQMLPLQQVIGVIRVINSYLLLGDGEFVMTLIKHVGECLSRRQKAKPASLPVRRLGKLEDVAIKPAELATVLAKTWSDLAALQNELETEENTFSLAKRYLRLSLAHPSRNANLPTILTPSPALLKLELPADSPLTMFLSQKDIDIYADITAYLFSIRRAEVRLSELWKLSGYRRCHPSPLAPPMSATPMGRKSLAQRRVRENKRNLQMRRHWSSISNTLFLVNELGAYLHGEIIHNSWHHLDQWLTHRNEPPVHSTRPSFGTQSQSPSRDSSQVEQDSDQESSAYSHHQSPNDDPRIMAQAHRAYLDALYSALLLDKETFIKLLRSLLDLIDHITALFTRLQQIWQGLDLLEDDGVMDAFTNYVQDEKDVLVEMDRSRNELDPMLRALVDSVKDIERDRDTVLIASGVASVDISGHGTGGFVPWKVRTLDRLIMKLDFPQGATKGDSEEEDEFVDAL